LILETDDLENVKKQLHTVKYAVLSDNKLQIMPENTQEALRLLHTVAPMITHFEYREGTIDDAFIALTGKEMH